MHQIVPAGHPGIVHVALVDFLAGIFRPAHQHPCEVEQRVADPRRVDRRGLQRDGAGTREGASRDLLDRIAGEPLGGPRQILEVALEDEGRSDEAFEQFKKAVELFPGAYSHINLGLAYIRREAFQEGIFHLRQAVELWPDLPEAHLYLAYGLEKNGKIQDAEKEYLWAIRLRANYLKGYRLLGEFYERQGKPRDARQAYQKLVELDPSQAWAQERLNRLTPQRPEDLDSHFERGFQQLSAGNYSEAVASFTEAYQEYAKDPDLLFNLAFSHQKLGNRTEAIKYYEELLQVTPAHVKGNFNLAYAYRDGTSAHDWSRSALLFKNVLKHDPGYSVAMFHLATVYWKLGNETEARRYDELYLKHGVHEDLKRRSQSRLSEQK
ncbi:tetratricopeptide repeat protein [candidate division KSB1 bacterium]|nr:tetratricopeptide repeat protein [candidate division KSB1 bacterium]